MERVTVAGLKARLSHYLREVRAGDSFVVVSRDIPVAVLGPYEPGGADDLEIIDAQEPESWGVVDSPPLGREIDVVALIRDDRDDRDGRLETLLREALESEPTDDDGRDEEGSP